MDNMIDRLERLAELAARKKVHLMVDAEQTYFQPAIDHMVFNLQKKFNKEFPAIYNTYQCYLTNTDGMFQCSVSSVLDNSFLQLVQAVLISTWNGRRGMATF